MSFGLIEGPLHANCYSVHAPMLTQIACHYTETNSLFDAGAATHDRGFNYCRKRKEGRFGNGTRGLRCEGMSAFWRRVTRMWSGRMSVLTSVRCNISRCEKEDEMCVLMCVTQWCGQDERCHRLQLPDLLISPMQHCTKVPLLLHNIGRYTHDDVEQQMLTESLRTLETSLGTSATQYYYTQPRPP